MSSTAHLQGDHSTKVEGVVQCVLSILQSDPATKILIFTMWQNVLSIIAQALADNDVSYLSLLANNKFQVGIGLVSVYIRYVFY